MIEFVQLQRYKLFANLYLIKVVRCQYFFQFDPKNKSNCNRVKDQTTLYYICSFHLFSSNNSNTLQNSDKVVLLQCEFEYLACTFDGFQPPRYISTAQSPFALHQSRSRKRFSRTCKLKLHCFNCIVTCRE